MMSVLKKLLRKTRPEVLEHRQRVAGYAWVWGAWRVDCRCIDEIESMNETHPFHAGNYLVFDLGPKPVVNNSFSEGAEDAIEDIRALIAAHGGFEEDAFINLKIQSKHCLTPCN